MSHAFRLVAVGAALVCMVGCYTVPAPLDVIPNAYPASGPLGFRLGGAWQGNMSFSSETIQSVDSRMDYLDGKDSNDLWEQGVGGFFEIPVDYNPFWGGFAGIGYDHMPGCHIDGNKVGDLQLLPMYLGLTARLPFWLNWGKYFEEDDPVWLPNTPIGPALYLRALGGGAYALDVPRLGFQGTPGRTRALDFGVYPFVEPCAGIEMRAKSWGFFTEVGYRHYFIESGRDSKYELDGVGGVRVSVGVSWYGF